MVLGICKYCGEEKELIKSHIIPKCLYKLPEFGRLITIETVTKNVNKVNHQNGLKEPLLCSKCDKELGVLDEYANIILSSEYKRHPFKEVGNIKTFLMLQNDFDYVKLRKFFISLIWRASISSIVNFSLGKYEKVALEILKGEIQDDPNLFIPVVLRKATGTQVDNVTLMFKKSLLGKKGCVFRFPNYEILIVTNSQNSNDNKAMELFRSLFTEREFLIVESNDMTLDDITIVDFVRKTFKL